MTREWQHDDASRVVPQGNDAMVRETNAMFDDARRVVSIRVPYCCPKNSSAISETYFYADHTGTHSGVAQSVVGGEFGIPEFEGREAEEVVA